MSDTLNLENPMCVYEELDESISKYISRYTRLAKRYRDDSYWLGKLDAYVTIAHLVTELECLEDAIHELENLSVYADKLMYSSYALGYANACLDFVNRARIFGANLSYVSLSDYKEYNTAKYIVEYYDNDGDVLSFEDVTTFRQALENAICEMYCKRNLDVDDMFHYAKAIIWKKQVRDIKVMIDVHSFKSGISHYMDVLASL